MEGEDTFLISHGLASSDLILQLTQYKFIYSTLKKCFLTNQVISLNVNVSYHLSIQIMFIEKVTLRFFLSICKLPLIYSYPSIYVYTFIDLVPCVCFSAKFLIVQNHLSSGYSSFLHPHSII